MACLVTPNYQHEILSFAGNAITFPVFYALLFRLIIITWF